MNNDDERISSLYREAGAPGPSKALDDAILEASRTAVKKPAAANGPFSGGWPAIASIAAVIVIAVILVPILRHQPAPQFTPHTSMDADYDEKFVDDGMLKTFDNNNVLKKESSAMPVPSSEALRSLQADSDTVNRARPDTGGMGSPASSLPEAAEIGFTETEQPHEEADAHMKSSPMEAADSAPFAINTPEMWEVKISRLITEGRLDDARAEVGKLERHYPGHVINETLLEQLD
jgi:hypothetical protein